MNFIVDLCFLILVDKTFYYLFKRSIVSNKIFKWIERCCKVVGVLVGYYLLYLFNRSIWNLDFSEAKRIFNYFLIFMFCWLVSIPSTKFLYMINDHLEMSLVMAACEYLLVS